jgi:hypothetical protein
VIVWYFLARLIYSAIRSLVVVVALLLLLEGGVVAAALLFDWCCGCCGCGCWKASGMELGCCCTVLPCRMRGGAGS